LFVPSTDPTTVWFKGEILQGDLSLPLPGDYWICACKRPWSAKLGPQLRFFGEHMAFPMVPDDPDDPDDPYDLVYRMNQPTPNYTEYKVLGGTWYKKIGDMWYEDHPTLGYGEAFWSKKTAPSEWLLYWAMPRP